MYDWLIVGAGFAGSVLAERLARERDERVLVIDRRDHIGGNAFDVLNEDGLLIHRYGPHIFHTNAKSVFDHLSQFTEWRPYEHRVLAEVDGQRREGEAWFTTDADDRSLRWGSEGPNDYHGELRVDGSGESAQVTVRLHTEHGEGARIQEGLEATLATIKQEVEGHGRANPS